MDQRQEKTALLIVDMQEYYISPDSDFFDFCRLENPRALEYLLERVADPVIPNIRLLFEGDLRVLEQV